MRKILKRCLVSICSVIAFLTMVSSTAMAGCLNNYTQQYDYDNGIDSWLSNSSIWYPALDGGYHLFSNPPLPTQISNPAHGRRELPNQGTTASDNFYTFYQNWIWNLPDMYTNDYPHRILYYKNDNHGQMYYDGVYNAYDALFVNFYERPKPSYQGCEAPRLADQSRTIYNTGNTYWVKTNDSVVFQNYGYNGSDGNWLRHSFLNLIDQYGHVLGSADAANGYASSSSGSSWINFQLTYASSNNGMNAGIYQFVIPQDNTTVTLHSAFQNGWGVGNQDGNYTGSSGDMSWKDSGYTIVSDGIAPGYDSVSDYQNHAVDSNVDILINLDQSLNLTAKIDNLFDKGSGVKDVYAKMYPTGREDEAKTVQLVNNNGEWQLPSTNAYSLFGSSDLNVDIYAEDNVGNVGKIKSQHYNLLTVNANIVPYNNPTSTGTPTLEAGQKAILKIYTTGYPDKLQITFPPELTTLDPTLNRTITIVPKPSAETDITFNVPRNTPQKNYTVNVRATNSTNNTTVETNPPFNVSGDILKGFRTTELDGSD